MGGGTGIGFAPLSVEELTLSKVNALSVKVVYDPNDETFTIMPEHGPRRRNELSAGEDRQFPDVARIHLERIIEYFELEIDDPQIREIASNDSEVAEYVFEIVSNSRRTSGQR